MALLVDYVDKSGRLNKDAYLNVSFPFLQKIPKRLLLAIYVSRAAYEAGKVPIQREEIYISEQDQLDFFSLELQQQEGNDLTKLSYNFLKSKEYTDEDPEGRTTIIPIDFTNAIDA